MAPRVGRPGGRSPGRLTSRTRKPRPRLSEVAAFLASVPAPVLPGAVEARISAALAAEAAARAGARRARERATPTARPRPRQRTGQSCRTARPAPGCSGRPPHGPASGGAGRAADGAPATRRAQGTRAVRHRPACRLPAGRWSSRSGCHQPAARRHRRRRVRSPARQRRAPRRAASIRAERCRVGGARRRRSRRVGRRPPASARPRRLRGHADRHQVPAGDPGSAGAGPGACRPGTSAGPTTRPARASPSLRRLGQRQLAHAAYAPSAATARLRAQGHRRRAPRTGGPGHLPGDACLHHCRF